MKFEIFQWLDINSMKPVYGVRMREPGSAWHYATERGKPAVTYNRVEALMFMDFLKLAAR